MRADRLLSLMMLLQTRGRMTAQSLAEELEVSERTIYRDLDALSAAGVPVYAERGPGGGCSLLDSYRTSLTGLTKEEVRALFMLSIPAPLAELGLGQELKAALLKLSAALPAALRPDEERARQRVHIDSVWWFHGKEPVPHLQTVQEAVWQDRKLHLTYSWGHWTEVERHVEAYGLVAKAGVWYLVWYCDGQMGAYRLSHLTEVRLSEESFKRSTEFDLAGFWKDWSAKYEEKRPYYPVSVRVAEHFVPYLPRFFGEQIKGTIEQAGPADEEGWITMTLPFEHLDEARSRILGFGNGVEVVEPKALRRSIQDYARQTISLYKD
jgi:predicted DNA-binding transcriptional regulator YafY